MAQLFKKILFLVLVLLILSGAGIVGAAVALDTKNMGVVKQGISIGGIPLSGLDLTGAVQKLESAFPITAESNLEFKDGEKNYIINLSVIEGRYDHQAMAESALKYGNEENSASRLASGLRLRAAPVDLVAKLVFSEEKLKETIKTIEKEWYKQPENAKVAMSGEEVIIVVEKTGYNLDFEKTLVRARQALNKGNLHIETQGRILKPELTSNSLEGINTLLAEYATNFDSSEVNRSHNIDLACSSTNEVFMKPGETFSLNRRLGPRLEETGYLEAPAYIGGSLSLDFGGGICQVASTLYNAVLFAELEIVERHCHPYPVSYVPPGRDATIAGDTLDLKFTNNLNAPVYIASQSENGELSINVFGVKKGEGRTVRVASDINEIMPDVIITRDYSLEEGETKVIYSGAIGYSVQVLREVIVNGKVVSREQISSDYYPPVNKVVAIGPEPDNEVK